MLVPGLDGGLFRALHFYAYQGAGAILGVMDGVQIQWLLDPDAVDLAETTAFAIQAIVAAVVAGSARPQPVPPPSF